MTMRFGEPATARVPVDAPPVDDHLSVAGEEDPGAAMDSAAPAAPPVVSVKRSAQIVGKVEYRVGDGANATIRPGPCEVEETALDATISWTDGDTHGVASMPIASFRRYLAGRALRFVDPQG